MLDASSIGLPDAFHAATAAKADAGEQLRPDVETLFRTPAVHAALAAILGDDFVCLPGDGALGYRGEGNTLDQQHHKDLTLYAVRDHRPEC
eukprot:COSAG04_NODE_15228_length_539_cov_0.709091_1_plen_90_part_10